MQAQILLEQRYKTFKVKYLFSTLHKEDNVVTTFVFISRSQSPAKLQRVNSSHLKQLRMDDLLRRRLQYRWAACASTSGKFVSRLRHRWAASHGGRCWNASAPHANEQAQYRGGLHGRAGEIGASLKEVPVCSFPRKFWGIDWVFLWIMRWDTGSKFISRAAYSSFNGAFCFLALWPQ